MKIEFAVSAEALLTIGGATVLSVIIAMWVKHYLANWRWTPLVVLGITEAFTMTAQFIVSAGVLAWGGVYAAVLMGLFGASLAVFGYETVVNALGLAGVGPRSVASQVEKAKALLAKEG
jgi:hypothetical protein